MRTVLFTGAALAVLAGSTAAQAADIYAPAPGYSGVLPPALAYGEGPPAQAVPGFVEAPPPAYAPLPPPVAYPVPPQYHYGAAGYGPQPGWVYSGPPVVPYDEVEVVLPRPAYRGAPVHAYASGLYRECWWEWGQRRCVVRRGW